MSIHRMWEDGPDKNGVTSVCNYNTITNQFDVTCMKTPKSQSKSIPASQAPNPNMSHRDFERTCAVADDLTMLLLQPEEKDEQRRDP